MNNNEFLAVYSGSGFFVASYQKRLIEEVIDAKEDETALSDDEVFSKVFEKKKSHNFLTLYGRTTSMPFLQNNNRCWSEFDFHMNSDVVYLTGILLCLILAAVLPSLWQNAVSARCQGRQRCYFGQ